MGRHEDGPKQRYRRQRMAGAEEKLALAATAKSFGLDIEATRRASDGSTITVDLRWTLKQLSDLNALRWAVEHGYMGGPDH